MGQDIRQVAVIGAGTMGTGIAALSAGAGLDVVLLDVDRARAEAALVRILEGRPPMLEDPQSARHIRLAVFPDEIATIRTPTGSCEAIVEDLQAERALLDLVEGAWRPSREVALAAVHEDPRSVMFADDAAGRFA